MLTRILQCMPGEMSYGGIESVVMKLYRNLDKTKFQYDFIVQGNKRSPYDDEIEKLGGKIYRLPVKSHHLKKYKAEFCSIIQNYKIIHIHSVYAFTFFEAKWAKHFRTKVIVHSHNSNAIFKRKIIHFLLRNKQSRYIDRSIAVSELAGKWMFGKNKFDVYYNGLDVSNYLFDANYREELRRINSISNKSFVVGCVGRLDWQKDPWFTYNMMVPILKKKSDVFLMFIGYGNLENDIKTKAVEDRIEEKVIFSGNVTNVPQYLSAIDLFVLPSRYEGLSLAIAEAQISGLPCLITENVARESVVTENVILLSKKNINVWTDEILIFIEQGFNINRETDVDKFAKFNINYTTLKVEDMYSSII